MEELKHISPDFDWSDGVKLENEVIYCTSSLGLNSPVLFQHFLQLSIQSKSNSIVLASNSTYEDILVICKRNGQNLDNAIQSGAMRLISVCLIEQEYVDDQFVLKRQDGTEIPRVPASQPSPATYIKSTLRDGYKLFLEETRKLAAQDPTSPVYFIIDDIFTLGSTIEAISASIRDLRCFVEDHFSSYSLVLCHPCGLDDDRKTYYQLVHMSDVQFALMPLATGNSSVVSGSLVVHRYRNHDRFKSVTVRKQVKIMDYSIRLLVPGSF